MPTTIRVALGERSYDIQIGRGLLTAVASLARERLAASRVVLVTDSGVRRPHAEFVAQSLAAVQVAVELLEVPAGEASKSVAEAERLWNELAARKVDRKAVVVAVGGGVVGDLAGFIAATYARGLTFVQIPTTLLAQVDSSVGGKVGINLPSSKNIVGAFWQPAEVLIDLDVLATLPEREYRSGLAEVVKYGVILDAEFFDYLEAHSGDLLRRDPVVLEHIIARSCRLKADVVEQDERELTGLRAVLNYGHTFCHAIETVSGYGRYLHGEAVAIGMVCAARLARLMGRIDDELPRRQHALLTRLGLPTDVENLPEGALLAAMQRDKKTEHGKLRFVLPSRLGHVELVGQVDPALVHRSLMSEPG
ncbi:MAG: 3-dehydroquinate synthase [Pirellulaceae bacterium]|jgi:3-dehydroquinate synthase|nr:3-dehydroquinate synthase [Pirellulaceae bacterium]